jgi:hypothetical protein
MTFCKLSAERSAAIDAVLYHLGGEEDRRLRALVARVVLTIEKLGEPARKSA